MKKISVLIIDDSEIDRYILKRDLETTGLPVSVFEEVDGEKALEFFTNYEKNRSKYPEDYPPVIIFLDINMPRMNGYEFLDNFAPLRDKDELKTAVVMLFTSSDSDKDKAKALSYSFVKDYLIKDNLNPTILKEKISTFIS